ncbi:MAG: glycosyltransferase [Clostridiales bacterium]|nr:glycosyltransferase [Clostridiales bacterium]
MEALILSCGTGGGHNAAAAAIRDELERRGHRCQMLNPYTLDGAQTAKTVDHAYVGLVQHAPGVFGLVYCIGGLYQKLPFRSPVYFANAKTAKALGAYLDRHSFDVVITTHLFPAEMLTWLKERRSDLPPTVFVATDYTCIPMVGETECDCNVIPAPELTGEFAKKGLDENTLFPLGIPVKSDFSDGPDRQEARKALGLDENRRYILVAGGSIGAGSVEHTLRLLLSHYRREDAELIVVCGNRQALYQRIQKRYGDRATVLGFTDRMAEYMKACDLLITKPGGLSSTEAAVAGIPRIHTSPIPGCETSNMRFFQRHGLSVAVPSPGRRLIAACDALLEDGKCGRPSEAPINPRAASDICDLAERLTVADEAAG